MITLWVMKNYRKKLSNWILRNFRFSSEQGYKWKLNGFSKGKHLHQKNPEVNISVYTWINELLCISRLWNDVVWDICFSENGCKGCNTGVKFILLKMKIFIEGICSSSTLGFSVWSPFSCTQLGHYSKKSDDSLKGDIWTFSCTRLNPAVLQMHTRVL